MRKPVVMESLRYPYTGIDKADGNHPGDALNVHASKDARGPTTDDAEPGM
jgi:hypothetical protein